VGGVLDHIHSWKVIVQGSAWFANRCTQFNVVGSVCSTLRRLNELCWYGFIIGVHCATVAMLRLLDWFSLFVVLMCVSDMSSLGVLMVDFFLVGDCVGEVLLFWMFCMFSLILLIRESSLVSRSWSKIELEFCWWIFIWSINVALMSLSALAVVV
jgi:hypothetical protein